MKKLKQKKGFSLIELLLVLGIIAALAITAFMIYPKVKSSNNAKIESSNINIIKASIKSLYSSSPNYTGLTTDVAIKAKVFPDTMVNADGTAALNTFKGAVTVEYYGISTMYAEISSFKITYSSVPPEECVKIVSNVANDFYQIAVNSKVIKRIEAGIGKKIDLNLETLSTTCAAAENAVIVFYSLN